jgi:hypothetical protein
MLLTLLSTIAEGENRTPNANNMLQQNVIDGGLVGQAPAIVNLELATLLKTGDYINDGMVRQVVKRLGSDEHCITNPTEFRQWFHSLCTNLKIEKPDRTVMEAVQKDAEGFVPKSAMNSFKCMMQSVFGKSIVTHGPLQFVLCHLLTTLSPCHVQALK